MKIACTVSSSVRRIFISVIVAQEIFQSHPAFCAQRHDDQNLLYGVIASNRAACAIALRHVDMNALNLVCVRNDTACNAIRVKNNTRNAKDRWKIDGHHRRFVGVSAGKRPVWDC